MNLALHLCCNDVVFLFLERKLLIMRSFFRSYKSKTSLSIVITSVRIQGAGCLSSTAHAVTRTWHRHTANSRLNLRGKNKQAQRNQTKKGACQRCKRVREANLSLVWLSFVLSLIKHGINTLLQKFHSVLAGYEDQIGRNEQK